jgi:hypothetical protein
MANSTLLIYSSRQMTDLDFQLPSSWMLFCLVYFRTAAVAYKQISYKVPHDNNIYTFDTRADFFHNVCKWTYAKSH